MKRRMAGLYALHAGMAAAVLCTAVGCAAGPARASKAALDARVTESPAAPPADTAALDELSARRQAERKDGDYLLGEGDVVAIRAYDLDEMNQKVRVGGDGSITLPLLDSVPVGGRSVSEVQQDLTKRLGAFMYDPHITVFVEEYRSQQVAVQGAVQKPGLVPQVQRSATVRDALAEDVVPVVAFRVPARAQLVEGRRVGRGRGGRLGDAGVHRGLRGACQSCGTADRGTEHGRGHRGAQRVETRYSAFHPRTSSASRARCADRASPRDSPPRVGPVC